MKKCKKCNETKDLSEFSISKNKKASGGYYLSERCVCKSCVTKMSNEAIKKRCGSETEEGLLAYKNLKNFKHRLKKNYGLTIESANAILDSQEHKCAICFNPIFFYVGKLGDRNSVACIDHEHSTGNVRGILCHRCNVAIGLLRDDVSLLDRAKSYLAG